MDGSAELQNLVNSIEASVALVGRDEAGVLVVSACNDKFLRMLGRGQPAIGFFPVPFDAVVPNYARPAFRDKLLECFSTGVPQELEQAYDLREGTYWWRLSLKPFHHIDGGTAETEILITGLDITAKMLLRQELEISTSRFRSVVDAAYDAIITVDQQHNITLFNRSAETLFGYRADEVLNQPIERLLPEKFRTNHRQYMQQFTRSPVNSRQMDERNRVYGLHRDGTLLPVEIAISKISVGGLQEFTAVIRDITDRVRLMDLLQKQAVTDELTGLPNRREFLEVVGDVLATDADLSVFMLDIDHFKKINDTYGHDIGDDVLRVLSRVAMASTRAEDIFARWGGEEFVAALPGVNLEQATALAEKLRLSIAHENYRHDWKTGGHVAFTVSIGVAERQPKERDASELIRRADQALYRAKHAGRNCVQVN